MTRTGRAVLSHGQSFEIREYPVPDPGPNTILLKQELAGICGTDLHNWQNSYDKPVFSGHENVGIITALGKGVTTDYVGNPVKEGDRVIHSPRADWGIYGFYTLEDETPPFSGGFGDYIYLSSPGSCFIKTSAPPEVAVITEPFAIATHGIMRSGIQLGDTVVVQGSGAIGLLTMVCAKMKGAAKLIMVGGPKERLDLAKRLGADVVIDIEDVRSAEERTEIVKSHTTRGEGADVVFECAGFLPATPEGLGYVRHSGTYVEMGHFVDMGSIDFNINQLLMRKNLTFEAIWGSRYEHFVRGLPMLERNEFPFADVVSHTLPLEDIAKGFDALNGDYRLDGETVIKIAVRGEAIS
ncbi:MAG: zinc-binding dehydrogenase [Chloroflexota bacterium]